MVRRRGATHSDLSLPHLSPTVAIFPRALRSAVISRLPETGDDRQRSCHPRTCRLSTSTPAWHDYHEHEARAVLYCPGNLSGDLGLGHAVHALCSGRFTALVDMADNADGDRFPEWCSAPEVVTRGGTFPRGRGMAALLLDRWACQRRLALRRAVDYQRASALLDNGARPSPSPRGTQ